MSSSLSRVRMGPARRKTDVEGLWLITFADLMVQLMAFFAVIYSFSAQDSQKLREVLISFQNELGVKGTGILPGSTGLDPNRAADLEKHLADLPPVEGEDVGVRLRIVSFRGAVLFSEGVSAVPPDFEPMLERISQMVKDYPRVHPGLRGPRRPRREGPPGGCRPAGPEWPAGRGGGAGPGGAGGGPPDHGGRGPWRQPDRGRPGHARGPGPAAAGPVPVPEGGGEVGRGARLIGDQDGAAPSPSSSQSRLACQAVAKEA